MGLLGKMKDAITGGAAKVSIEYPSQSWKPGDSIHVKVTVLGTGSQFKSKGVYVDLMGKESGSVSGKCKCSTCRQSNHKASVDVRHNTFNQSFPISGALELQGNETKVFEGDIQIPQHAQPTYQGSIRHEWLIRGRLDAFGNDPDSGFQSIVVK